MPDRQSHLGEIVPIGLSGNLVELFDVLNVCASIAAILDDDCDSHGNRFRGVPVRPMANRDDYPGARFLLMIGSARSHRARKDILATNGFDPDRFASFVHPNAEVSGGATIQAGAVLYSGAMVTAHARIGKHALVLPRSIVHHDAIVGDFTVVGAGVILAGGARVGEGCFIGSGSLIRDGVTIGDGALVGMGSVVVTDVAPFTTVAGNPARELRPRQG